MPGVLSYFENLTLTNDQHEAALQLEAFLNGNERVFMLKGYAGTGKTTLLGGICRYILRTVRREVRLMAPTGRAAKVLSDKNEGLAFSTIHRGIYNFHRLDLETTDEKAEESGSGFQFVYKLANDDDILRQVFVVDEASMVSDVYAESEFFRFGSGFLLRDLLTFTKVRQSTAQTKLIFVGDPAQLPPFGMTTSPALDPDYFAKEYGLAVRSVELKEVIRQGADSGVLVLATDLREQLASGFLNQFLIEDNGRDVCTLTGGTFWEAYDRADANKKIITFKNKTAKDLNDEVRKRTFGPNAPSLLPGDLVVVGQNNYTYGVTNGTFGKIQGVGKVERETVLMQKEKPVELRWQKIELLVRTDTAELRTIEALNLLNFLESDERSLTSAEMRALFVHFVKRKNEEGIKRNTPEFSEALKTDPYFTALMLKHAYAITGHKAQGGEWKSVFTVWDMNANAPGFNPLTDEQPVAGRTNTDFYRWAYTAVTRSSHEMLAVNPPRISPFTKMSWIDSVLAGELLASEGVRAEQLSWGDEQQALIDRLGLGQRPLFIQHRIAALAHVSAPHGVTVQHVRGAQNLEAITFAAATDQVTVNVWYNKDRRFTKQLKDKGSDTLWAMLSPVLSQVSGIAFELPSESLTPATPATTPALPQTAETPFITLLRRRLTEEGQRKDIRLVGFEPLSYRVRCSFERKAETAAIDCIYDGDGFFTTVQPLSKQTNSAALLASLKQIIQTLRT